MGANFAGHYSVVAWGCGTECETFMIVDLKTGKVFDGGEAKLKVATEVKSRLLIVNPIEVIRETYKEEDLPSWLITQYYVWDGAKLKPICQIKAIESRTSND